MSSTFTDVYRVQEELEVFARNQDILTTAERGVTTFTDTITATGGATFNLTASKGVRNIRFVTVGGSTKNAYRDYTPAYATTTSSVTFASTPSTGSSVVIRYDQGIKDTIYGTIPQSIVDRLTYPRMMVKVISEDTKEFALGGGSNISDRLITFQVWSTTQKRVFDAVSSVRQVVLSNKKNFYNFPFITVVTGKPVASDHEEIGEIFTKNVDCTARFTVERV